MVHSNSLRTYCLNVWTIFSLMVFAIKLVQTICGRLTNIEHIAWIWFMLNVCPGLFILMYSKIKNPSPSDIPELPLMRFLKLGPVIYALLLLITILTEPLVMRTIGIKQHLINSYWWLGTSQVVIVWSFILSFILRVNYIPSESKINVLTQELLNKSKAKGDKLKTLVYETILTKELNETFKLLQQEYTTDEERLKDLIVLNAEYLETKRALDLNLIDRNEAQRIINRITMALINMV